MTALRHKITSCTFFFSLKMSFKQKLQQITERAKIKASFNEDTRKFASIILKDWLERCAVVANEGESELTLLAFRADAVFEGNRIIFLVKNGLLELIEKETSLATSAHHFLVLKDSKTVREVDDLAFETLHGNDSIFHFITLKVSW